MRLSHIFCAFSLSALPPTIFATIQTVAYDPVYDNPNGSLTTVACSNGTNGLITRGYKTFGSLPSFPNISAAFAVSGWNSIGCGTCWQLTYANAQGAKKSINVTAIDVAGSGFNLALTAMDTLIGGQAVHVGRIEADAVQVPASGCGL